MKNAIILLSIVCLSSLSGAVAQAALAKGSAQTYQQIREVMAANKGNVRECYKSLTAQPKHRNARGRMDVAFDLGVDGTVYNARFVKAEIKDESFQNCLLRTLSDLKFPEQDEVEHIATYPFMFEKTAKSKKL